MSAPSILAEIIAHKRREVAAARALRPLAQLEAGLADAPRPRGFVRALSELVAQRRTAVIAEIKRASPSRGIIRKDFQAARHAAGYQRAGAACLSVLTDQKYFHGSLADLRGARGHCKLPLLRKDFMVDEYQLVESRIAGADCILLIVAALSDAELRRLAGCAAGLELDVLVEVHDREELDRALALDCPLIGINNRDLRNFRTSLETTLDLLPHVPQDRTLITESGIGAAADMAMMMRRGVHGFLIGETFMRAPEPGAALARMLSAVSGESNEGEPS